MSINNKPDFVKKFPSYFDSRKDIKANREEGTKNSFKHLWNKHKVANGLLSFVSFGLYYAYLRCWKAPKFYEKNSRAYICLNHLKDLNNFSVDCQKITANFLTDAAETPNLDIYKRKELSLAIAARGGKKKLDLNVSGEGLPIEKWKGFKDKLKEDKENFRKNVVLKVNELRILDRLPLLTKHQEKEVLKNAFEFSNANPEIKLFEQLKDLDKIPTLFSHQVSNKPKVKKVLDSFKFDVKETEATWARTLAISETDPRGRVQVMYIKDENRDSSVGSGVYPWHIRSEGKNNIEALRQFKMDIKGRYRWITDHALEELDGILQLAHTQIPHTSFKRTFDERFNIKDNLKLEGLKMNGTFHIKLDQTLEGKPVISFVYKQDDVSILQGNAYDANLKAQLGIFSSEYTYSFELKENAPDQPSANGKTQLDYWKLSANCKVTKRVSI